MPQSACSAVAGGIGPTSPASTTSAGSTTAHAPATPSGDRVRRYGSLPAACVPGPQRSRRPRRPGMSGPGFVVEVSVEAPAQAVWDGLVDWLRTRPMMHVEGGYAMVHAGLLPSWTIDKAASLGKEVEAALAATDYREFFRNMYGSRPDHWTDSLTGWDRLDPVVAGSGARATGDRRAPTPD